MPEQQPFYKMDRVDRVIAKFASLDNPTQGDLNLVRTVASVERGLLKYRLKGHQMDQDQLENEKHRSQRLGRHMERTGDKKPHPKCHAHAIVPGGHPSSEATRAILALFKLRIDDPYNGCWLPGKKNDLPNMPKKLENAAPHLSLHREEYYEWLDGYINLLNATDRNTLIQQLQFIEHRLQTGAFPPEIIEGKKR